MKIFIKDLRVSSYDRKSIELAMTVRIKVGARPEYRAVNPVDRKAVSNNIPSIKEAAGFDQLVRKYVHTVFC